MASVEETATMRSDDRASARRGKSGWAAILLTSALSAACSKPSAQRQAQEPPGPLGPLVDAAAERDAAAFPLDGATAGPDAEGAPHDAAPPSTRDAQPVVAPEDAAVVSDAAVRLDGGATVDGSLDAAVACTSLPLPLSGAFLQMTNDHDERYWADAVVAMSELGMDTVIVQTVAYGTDAVLASHIRTVLDSAARYQMRVYLGLRLEEEDNGSIAAAANEGKVDAWIAAGKASADAIATAYGSHAAWAGWYLPMEAWTPAQSGELGYLPKYFAQLSAYCKTKKNLPVAISPFISESALARTGAPALTTSTYRSLLEAASLDVVMLQDGVGAIPVADADIATKVPAFMAAMESACVEHGVSLWANVESFESNFATPTTFQRLDKQLAAAAGSAMRAVTFEFSYYWYAPGRGGAAAARLSRDYESAYRECLR